MSKNIDRWYCRVHIRSAFIDMYEMYIYYLRIPSRIHQSRERKCEKVCVRKREIEREREEREESERENIADN